MIRRSRKKVIEPVSLNSTSKAIIAELAHNQAIVDKNDASGDPWEKWSDQLVFKAYSKDADVKSKLSALFSNKCAYCEGSLSVTDMHTEHYRPKGEVHLSDDPKNRGYWWLAAHWANLLPACGFCNRSPGTDHPTGIRYGSGKGTRFPLLPGSIRAVNPGDEKNEKPALLDPSVDEPSDYFTFEFLPKTKLWEVVKRQKLSPGGELRAQQTIDIFGLKHPGLSRERGEHLKGVAIAAKAYAEAAVAYNNAVRASVPPAAVTAACRTAKASWRDLYDAYLKPESRYLHVTVRCVELVLSKYGLRLKDLLGGKRLHLPSRNFL